MCTSIFCPCMNITCDSIHFSLIPLLLSSGFLEQYMWILLLRIILLLSNELKAKYFGMICVRKLYVCNFNKYYISLVHFASNFLKKQQKMSRILVSNLVDGLYFLFYFLLKIIICAIMLLLDFFGKRDLYVICKH